MPKQSATLLQQLETRKQTAVDTFSQKHSFAKQWLSERGLNLSQIRAHSARLLTGATLGTTLLLSSPVLSTLQQPGSSQVMYYTLGELLHNFKSLPHKGGPSEQEQKIIDMIKQKYGITVAFTLNNQRLPYYRGRIGLEQHLVRFPGDTLSQHEAWQQAGMAPGRSAFGFFAETGKPIDVAIEQERYYIVLQTFVLPGWNQQWTTLKDWYKFRKFIVINPETGQAVVSVLGDSGPGISTGKVFGGSPEVMADIGFYPARTSGEVIVLFVDDPENKIPLGPISVKGEKA